MKFILWVNSTVLPTTLKRYASDPIVDRNILVGRIQILL